MPSAPAKTTDRLWGVLGLAIFFLIWQVLAGFYPPFILPSPSAVLARVPDLWREGYAAHLWVTLGEAGGGFALALLAALPLGTALARWPWLEKLLAPYVVGSQAIPIVALAPLLVLWFGTGFLPKILVAALVAFFPLLTNVVVGFKGIDPRLRELLAIMGASSWQRWRVLDLPAALPVVFGGLRIGLTLSVIGAVVGEFAGAERGLGFLVNWAKGLFDTPLMFLGLALLAAAGVTFYLCLALLERLLLPWRRQG
ncbi:MAG: ABC transporter permease [Bacteroidota bacterium]